jgi:hypothetical protein
MSDADGTVLDALDRLDDPNPPTAGHAQRDAVLRRAGSLQRRRRALQGAGTLACVALIGVGAVAFISAEGSGGATSKIDAASAPEPDTSVTTSTAAPPSVVSTAPVAIPEPTLPVAVAESSPPAPPAASVTASGPNVPSGVTLNVTLIGAAGTVSTSTTSGAVSFADLPPGNYELRWDWSSPEGATAVGRQYVTIVEGPNSFSF